MVRSGKVGDIIDIIRYADQHAKEDAADFAKFLVGRSDYDTLRNVYRFVRSTVDYERDKPFDEVIKTPGCTIQEGEGDCKSQTILTGSLLHPLGFNFFYRVAFYDPDEPEQGHIYTVVVLDDGRQVIVDPVHNRFDTEDPYYKAEDYPAAGKSALSGLIGGGVGNWLLPIGLAVLISIFSYD